MSLVPVLRSTICRKHSHRFLQFKSLQILPVKRTSCIACKSCQNLRTVSSFDTSTSFPQCLNNEQKLRNYSTDSGNTGSTIAAAPTIGKRIMNAVQYIGWLATRGSILQLKVRQIYGCCTDDVDYKEIFEVCNMPDTFQSWFLVVHLHIWMCYVRLNLFEEDGQVVNQKMAEFMWEDIRERIKKLGVEDTKARKEGFKELSKQFYGLTIAYNKAIMSENEKDFSDVLWRNLFHEKERASRKNLDVLVKYVDKQLTMLDNMTKEELLEKGKVTWIPLKDIVHVND